MTNKKCNADLLSSLTSAMPENDAAQLSKQIQQEFDEIEALGDTPSDAAILTKVDELIKSEQEQLNKMKIDAARNARILKEKKAYIDTYKDKIQGVQSISIGSKMQKEGARYSAQLAQHAAKAQIFGTFINQLEKSEVLDYFKNEDNGLDIAKALRNEPYQNESSKKVANIYKKILNDSVKELNSLGANIKIDEDYIARQTNNPVKIAQVSQSLSERITIRYNLFKKHGTNFRAIRKDLNNIAYTRWRNTILPLLDEKRTFAGADKQKFLKGAYRGITTNLRLPYTGEEVVDEEGNVLKAKNASPLFRYAGPGNLAKKLSQPRKLHFKDAESWYKYNEIYGQGTFTKSVETTLLNTANALGLMRRLGTNPSSMYNALLDYTFTESAKMGEYSGDKLRKDRARLSAYMDMLDGTANIPVNTLGARIGANIRAWTNISKLGGVVLSSFPDFTLKAELLNQHGMNYFDAYSKSFSDMFKGRPKGEMKELANLLGTWSENEMGGMISRFAPFETPEGLVSSMQMKFFKLTGMPFMDEISRTSIAAALAENLAKQKHLTLDKLSGNLRTILPLYGINEKEWNLIRKNDNLFTIESGKQFITPDAANSYTEESIKEYLGKKEVTPEQIDAVKKDLSERLHSFYIDQTDESNLRPGVEDKFTWTRGTRPGTVAGEFARFVGHYKYYSVTYARRTLGRKFYGLDKGLVEGASVDVAGLVHVIVGSTILGYISMNAKAITKGRTPVSPFSVGALTASFAQGGGLGIFGDFLIGNYDRFGHGITQDLLGPDITSMSDLVTIIFKIKAMEDPTNAMFQFAKNNTPGINLYYTRIFLDYALLYGIQEHVSPGSLRRYENSIEENTGQSFIFDPYEYALGV